MSISFSLQATKLVSELTILYSQTRWELWLKTELSILTSVTCNLPADGLQCTDYARAVLAGHYIFGD